MYGDSDADRKEFLKDMSAFANARGGHPIIGIDEAAGVPTAFAGTHRFWIRDSTGAHEASMAELRGLFSEDADAARFIRAFRDEQRGRDHHRG